MALGVFLDTETSGLNPSKHHVLEVAFKVVDIKTGQCLSAFEETVAQSRANWEKASPASLRRNGFSWQEIAKGTAVEKVAGAVVTRLAQHHVRRGEAVFICQNPSFDRPFFSQIVDPDLQEMLQWPYHWLDLASMYWAKHARKEPFPWQTGVSKDSIAQAYALPPEPHPHRAMNGVDHLIQCYTAVVGFPEMAGNPT